MNLLVTGGTGVFGLSLLRHWHRSRLDGKVTILSRNPRIFEDRYPELAKLVNWLEGDILDESSLPFNRSFSHIIHAAADSTRGYELSPLQRYDQVVEGTRNILKLAIRAGANRVLYTSTGGVYGPAPENIQKIPESYLGMPDPTDPKNAYSVGKRVAEHLCSLYLQSFGVKTIIARCFSFAGKDIPLDAHFAIGNFTRDALYRPSITVNGDGTAIRSYLDQKDLAEWLLTLLSRGRAGHAYNIGSSEGISILNLANLVRDTIAPEKPVYLAKKDFFTSVSNHYVPDTTKAERELNLKQTISLESSIKDAAKYHRDNGPL